MTLERFFAKFDQFADAPDAIAKMRELVLELAVRGKLVPNDPREKPVSLTLSGTSPDHAALPLNWRGGLVGDAFTFEYGDNLPAPKRTETGEYPVYGSKGIVGIRRRRRADERQAICVNLRLICGLGITVSRR